MRRPRVLHVAAHDGGGGAARAAYALHAGLRDLGIDSRMLVSRKRSGDTHVTALPRVRGFGPVSRYWRRRARATLLLKRHRKRRPAGAEPFSREFSPYEVERAPQLAECDIVNLHWVAGFLDLERFFRELPTSVPVVWTLHDMNLLTGGCHYDAGCGRFLQRCGACPQLGSGRARDPSRRSWERKRALFERLPPGRLEIVTPSRWLAEEARRSSLLGDTFRIRVIPYGVDLEAFAPRDRSFARRVLGIREERRVLLFVAQSLRNDRKGFDLLLDAFRRLQQTEGLLLLSLGKPEGAAAAGIPHLSLGHTSNDRLLSLVYSAADLFVCPSRQDNLPLTVVEALACGVPVVGFDVGGVPDMVRPGATGTVVPPEDAGALSRAIREILYDGAAREAMAAECRRVAEAEYGMGLQAHRYADLYRERLGRTVRRAPVPSPDRAFPLDGERAHAAADLTAGAR